VKNIFLFALLSLSLASHGAVEGKWSGDINYSNENGPAGEPLPTTVELTSADCALTFTESLFGETWNFHTNGEQVLLNDAVVGSNSAEGFAVSFIVPGDEACTLSIGLTSGGTYLNRYDCTDGYLDLIEGTLSQDGDAPSELKLSRSLRRR
jgi:hypothetical protein